MSGVLHPMGPEPAQTYWVRRGVLLAVVLLLATAVVFGVANLTKAAVATAPPPPIPPAVTSPTPSTTPRPSTTVSTPPAGSTPSGGTSGGPSASAPTSAPASSAPSSSTAAKPSATPSAKPSPTATVIGTPDCAPAGLRVTLKGDRSLSPGQNNTFTLALVNPGARTCLTSVTDKNFELKIYSGKDRIWSSQDCGKALAAFDKKLAPGAGVSWTMTWNGERSVKGKECKRGADTPQAGTYWATAQLDGAKPVQLRMIIS